MGAFFAKIGKFFADLVTNVKGQGDLHKVMGYVFAITGLICSVRPNDPIPVQTFLAIEGVAGMLLGISLVGDGQAIKAGDPPRYQ